MMRHWLHVQLGGCNEMGYDSYNELSEANAGRSDGH